jgi:Bacterial aa3 type cytochrome c oxidase subunit IV
MHIDQKRAHPAMDYAEHTKTYGLFLKGTLYLLLAVVAIMAFLAFFVA